MRYPKQVRVIYRSIHERNVILLINAGLYTTQSFPMSLFLYIVHVNG